jgi:hypothetical protein
VSRLSTRLSTTRWKPAVLRGLGDREVAAILKVVAPSISTLPRVVIASITQIKVGLLIQLLILCPITL